MSNIRSKLLLVQHARLDENDLPKLFFAIIHDIVIKIFSSPHPLTERTTACSAAQTEDVKLDGDLNCFSSSIFRPQ